MYTWYSMSEITTVKISKKTRDKLAELGSKKETYENIIERLIEFYEKNNQQRVSAKQEGEKK